MKEYTLLNDELEIKVSSKGAELQSLKDRKTGREYLWQGDERFWSRRSPVLFPLVGRYVNNSYVYKGKVYHMNQHGFVRDMETEPLVQEKTRLILSVHDTEETRRQYPFRFALNMGYELNGRKLNVFWEVTNTGTEKMYFSIGAHPGFNCNPEKSSLVFDTEAESLISGTVDTEHGNTLGDELREIPLNEGAIVLSGELFAGDALVIDGHQAHEVRLEDKEEGPLLKVNFDTGIFGIWAPYKPDVPFVCIEPWYGRCDRRDFDGNLEKREHQNVLEAGCIWKASYRISII